MAIDGRTKWIGGGLLAIVAAGTATWWFTRRETPPSTLVLKDGAIEVRAYDAFQVIEVVQPGLRDAATAEGLNLLLDHLSGVPHEGILMPVLSDPQGAGWRTRIILHGDAKPAEGPDGVTSTTVAARRMAALAFQGPVTDKALARHEAKRRRWLEGYGLKVEGPWELATYSKPDAPALLQRHELLFPVASLY